MNFRHASPYHAESDPLGYRICWAQVGEETKYTASRNGSPSVLLLTTVDKAEAKQAAANDARRVK